MRATPTHRAVFAAFRASSHSSQVPNARDGKIKSFSQAGVAQLVEQLIRNQQVTRSSRVAGSSFPKKIERF
jgi:hypothetical protein